MSELMMRDVKITATKDRPIHVVGPDSVEVFDSGEIILSVDDRVVIESDDGVTVRLIVRRGGQVEPFKPSFWRHIALWDIIRKACGFGR